MLIEFQYPVFTPPLGGVENYIIEAAKAFKKLGHQCQVFCGKGPTSTEASPLTVYEHSSSRPSGLRLLFRPLVEYQTLCTLQKETNRPQPDIIIARHPSYALSAKKSSGSQSHVVYLPGVSMLERLENESRTSGRKRDRIFGLLFHPQWKWLEQRALKESDRAMVLSQNMVRQMSTLCHRALSVNPAGINLDTFNADSQKRDAIRKQHSISNEEILILTVSRLSFEKNISFGIRLMKHLKGKLRYIVLGTGSQEASLQRLIHSLHLGDSVELAGLVDNPQDYYAAADIYLHPAMKEPFGHVLLEAMASSLPVAATDPMDGKYTVATNELVPLDCGIHINIDDICSSAAQLSNLIDNEELRTLSGENGRQFVEQSFSWSRHVGEIIKQHEDKNEEEKCGQVQGND